MDPWIIQADELDPIPASHFSSCTAKVGGDFTMSDKNSSGLREANPRYSLHIENPKKNVFVTQLGEERDEEKGDVTHIPVIREKASKVLETGANTLQKTLVLKKEVELDLVNAQLLAKQQEFKERMEAVEQKRADFMKHQEEYNKEAIKFGKFLKDSDAKRRQAIQTYQRDLKQNEMKRKEINELTQQLGELRIRQKMLQKLVAKYKIYEDYLLKVIDHVPKNYLEYGGDSPINAVIQKYETLSATNKTLLSRQISLSEDYEKTQHKLEDLRQEHNTMKLMLTSDLSQLQMKYDRIQETNKQLELNVNLLRGHFQHQSVDLASLLLSIANLGEQCHMPHYGPLQNLKLLPKLDMIKEFILEKMNVEQLTSQLAMDANQRKKIGASKEMLKSKVASVGGTGTVQTQQNICKIWNPQM